MKRIQAHWKTIKNSECFRIFKLTYRTNLRSNNCDNNNNNQIIAENPRQLVFLSLLLGFQKKTISHYIPFFLVLGSSMMRHPFVQGSRSDEVQRKRRWFVVFFSQWAYRQLNQMICIFPIKMMEQTLHLEARSYKGIVSPVSDWSTVLCKFTSFASERSLTKRGAPFRKEYFRCVHTWFPGTGARAQYSLGTNVNTPSLKFPR